MVVEGNRPLQGCRAQIPPPLSTPKNGWQLVQERISPPSPIQSISRALLLGEGGEKHFLEVLILFYFF